MCGMRVTPPALVPGKANPVCSVLREGMTWRGTVTNLPLDCSLALAWSKWRTELSSIIPVLDVSCAQCLPWDKCLEDEFIPSVCDVLNVLVLDISSI